MQVEREALLPGGVVPDILPLYSWLEPEAIEELIGAYYKHEKLPRPNGLFCAETNVLVRTHAQDMAAYCRKVRACRGGRGLCRESDYTGVRTAILRRSPFVYSCGSLAYDFVVPLRGRDGSIPATFINGQLRPRIVAPEEIRFSCKQIGLGVVTPEDYSQLSVLDLPQAHATCEYLQEEFADRLAYHNERSRLQGLDIGAFRRDVAVLGKMLEDFAINGLIREDPDVIGSANELRDRFVMAPWIASGQGVDGPAPMLEVSIRHPTERQLRSYFCSYSGTEALAEACRKLEGPTVMGLGGNGELRTLLDQFNRACYESLGVRDTDKLRWLVVPMRYDGREGALAVAAKHSGDLGDLRDAAVESAGHGASYVERYNLARLITRSCGLAGEGGPSPERRRMNFRELTLRVGEMVEGQRKGLALEWLPLLDDLEYALKRVGDPGTLSDEHRRSFDEYVVPAVGSAYYSPIKESRAAQCLRSVEGHTGEEVAMMGRRPLADDPLEAETIRDLEERMQIMDEGLRCLEEYWETVVLPEEEKDIDPDRTS